MGKYRKLSHTIYECEYHIVWTSKYRYRILTGKVNELLEKDLYSLSKWKEVVIDDLNIQRDHIHLLASIPHKLSVSNYMGMVKGKTAIKLFKTYPKLKEKLYWGNHFWSRGYFASTVGLDEDLIRRYVKYQGKEDQENETRKKKLTLF